jgi:hypothetical protein
MSASPTDGGSEPAPSKRWVPFWVLQAAELAVALVFVDVAVHLDSEGALIGGAALLALLALTARGPLGIARICPKPVHVVLAVVAGLAIALSPILPVLRPDLAGIVVAEFAAVGLIRLATLTRTAEPAPAGETPAAGAAEVPAAEARAAEARNGEHDDDRGDEGQRTDLTVTERSMRSATAAAVVGRRAVERYRPAAEDGARRAIRGAGRSVGRVLRRASPPAEGPR